MQRPSVDPRPRSKPEHDGRQDHVVGFFEDDADLAVSIADRVAPALAAGDVVLLIATGDHRRGIEDALAARGIDVGRVTADARLRHVDAAVLLDEFMADGGPDPPRFHATMDALLRRMSPGRPPVVFGEMVALLWERGDVTSAIGLEDLWNDLADRHRFALLCGYPLRAFDGPDGVEAFRAVCDRHTGVLPTAGDGRPAAREDEGQGAVARMRREAGVAERIRSELEQRLAHVGEAERLQREFVASVVHDVRTPAATACSYLELLREARGELTDEQVDDYLEVTLESVRRVERLAGDLLRASRAGATDYTFDLRTVDLGELVDRAVDDVRRTSGRRVEVARSGRLPPVIADAGRQRQILDNLLSNAVKFSSSPTPVRVEVVERPADVVVTVRDEGPGVPPEQQVLLFQPFARLPDAGHGAAIQGTGLGLHAVRALVEGQGGTVWVDSRPGRGAAFSYTVPRAAPST